MALQRQNLTVSLAKGVDTKTDPMIMQEGVLQLNNAAFKAPGEIQKRYGLNALGNETTAGASITSAKALAVFQNELNLISNDNLYSYAVSGDNWVDKGPLSGVSAKSTGIIRNTTSQSNPSIAYNNGITAYACEDSSGGIKICLYDESSGQAILNNYSISSAGIRPKCSVAGSYILFHYVDSGVLKSRRVSVSNTSVIEAEITVASAIHASGIYDIAPFGNNNIIAFRNDSSKITTAFLMQTGDIGSALYGFPSQVEYNEDANGSICIHGYSAGDLTNDGIYVIWHNSTTGTRAIIYNTQLSNSPTAITINAGTTTVRNITALNLISSQIQIFYEVSAAQTYNYLVRSALLTRAGVASSDAVFCRSVGLSSKAFLGTDSRIYVIVSHESTLQACYFVARSTSTSSYFIANRVSYQNAGGHTASVASLSGVVYVGSSVYAFVNTIKTKLNSESGAIFSNNGIQKTELNFNNEELYNTAQLGNNLHIASGMIFVYDGVNIVEHGYNLYPENVSGSSITTTGNVPDGDHYYSVVYEWTDIQGQIHRSAPSIPLKVTTAGGGTSKVTLTVPTLRLTERKGTKGEASIVVYRAEVGGTVYYRVSSVSSPTLNDTAADTVTITDILADTAIISNELLYTTGGILENIAPPSASLVYVYNNRLIIAGLENPNEIWMSKQFAVGESVGFSDLIVSRIDQGSAGILGIAQLDEKMVYFKRNSIYVQVANGPTDTGFNNDFGVPQASATDVGCISHRSISLTPTGLIFKSAKGYYMLDRSLQLDYIGAPVEAYNSLTCSGSVLVDDLNQIRITHTAGDCIVYDYYVKQWSVFTNHSCQSSRRWDNKFAMARSNGIVDIEDRLTYLDNSSHNPMLVTTPWIQTAGIQGFQRIYQANILGKLKSRHKLYVEIGYNFEEFYRDSFTIDTGTALGDNYFGQDSYFGESQFIGGMLDTIYQFKVNNSIQKCQAIRFRIRDINFQVRDGACMNLTAISLDVGVKGGINRIPKSKNM